MSVDQTFVTLGGINVPVQFRTNVRAKRISLRLDSKSGAAIVTLPKARHKREAEAFVRSHQSWILDRVHSLPPAVAFEDGAAITVLGQPLVIRSAPDARRGVWAEDGALWVSGPPEHLPRRVRDWLRAEAKRVITPRAHAYAEAVHKKPGRISVRDQRSRWGSCSANGDLSFSWRLILTPEWVLNYVIAHEVAHMVHHNHSRQFWALLKQLVPDVKTARDYLSENAARLHRIG